MHVQHSGPNAASDNRAGDTEPNTISGRVMSGLLDGSTRTHRRLWVATCWGWEGNYIGVRCQPWQRNPYSASPLKLAAKDSLGISPFCLLAHG